VNPLLTISALAERAASALAAERGWEEDRRYPAPALAAHPDAMPREVVPAAAAPAPPRHPGLRFSEHLSGYWSRVTADDGADAHDLEQYLEAFEAGEAAKQALSFVLTITTDDVAAVEARPERALDAVGTVSAPELSPEPLTVQGGTFQFKVSSGGGPDCLMRYRLPLVAVDGSRYFLDGFKTLKPGDFTDLWPDSTTLYVTLRKVAADGAVVGRGVLRISPGDFARQLTTLQVTGPVSALERLRLLGRFGRFFAGALLDDYGRVLHRITSFDPSAPPRRRRPLDVPGGKVFPYTTADGVELRLTRYQGGSRGPVVLSHGMGANPLTFTLDTIEPNLLEFLVGHGFDVWVQEWRGSTLLRAARSLFDADQVADHDHPAAADVVRRETGRADLHWVTHCVGSITSLMATMAGTIAPASLLCSQVGAHPVAARLTRIKIHLDLGKLLWGFGVRYLTTDSYLGESLGAQVTDQLLRLYPVPHAERCTSAVCRRLAFIYGIAVHHPAVDARTHDILHELFGVTNLDMMNHLARCAEGRKLVGAKGEDRYLPRLDRLQIPITFLHGAANLVWLPESTESTFALLTKEFGADLYRRVVFDSHGHQDTLMGAESDRDAFPAVLEHLERANA
jgi:cholesterol oxidase